MGRVYRKEPMGRVPWCPPFENREGWGSLSRGSAKVASPHKR